MLMFVRSEATEHCWFCQVCSKIRMTFVMLPIFGVKTAVGHIAVAKLILMKAQGIQQYTVWNLLNSDQTESVANVLSFFKNIESRGSRFSSTSHWLIYTRAALILQQCMDHSRISPNFFHPDIKRQEILNSKSLSFRNFPIFIQLKSVRAPIESCSIELNFDFSLFYIERKKSWG